MMNVHSKPDILDEMPALVFQMKNEIIVYANVFGAELLGYTPEEMEGQAVWSFLAKEYHAKHRTRLRQINNGRSVSTTLSKFVKKNRETIDMEVTGYLQGDVVSVLAYPFSSEVVELRQKVSDSETVIVELQNLINSQKAAISDLRMFSRTVAHDLRSPLALINGYLSVLQEDLASAIVTRPDGMDISGAISKVIETVLNTSRRMVSILEEMLLLAEIARGASPQQIIDMGTVIEQATTAMALRIQTSNALITTEPAWPRVIGYRPWLQQVWINLIANAIKYGQQPPRIWISYAEYQDTVEFFIEDNGSGIPADKIDKVWEEGYRLEEHAALRGNGLGLAIVKSIVEKLDGSVGIKQATNGGARVWFKLKKAK